MRSRVLLLLCLPLSLAVWSRGETPPEMVEMEARFYEMKAGQMPKLPGRDAPAPGANLPATEPSGAAALSEAPAVLLVAGVFTSEQAEAWTKELQSNGAKLLDRQKTVALSGHRARMKNSRELRYPSDFESSQTPGAEGLHPTAFEAKDVGFTMELEPRIGMDGYTIDLIFSPRIVEFQGFVDATKIPNGASAKQIQDLLKTPPKKGSAWQPIFQTREGTTEVTVYDGQTVVLTSPPSADAPGTVILLTARILPPQ